eukprot:570490-Amphidinium_carterae.1
MTGRKFQRQTTHTEKHAVECRDLVPSQVAPVSHAPSLPPAVARATPEHVDVLVQLTGEPAAPA